MYALRLAIFIPVLLSLFRDFGNAHSCKITLPCEKGKKFTTNMCQQSGANGLYYLGDCFVSLLDFVSRETETPVHWNNYGGARKPGRAGGKTKQNEYVHHHQQVSRRFTDLPPECMHLSLSLRFPLFPFSLIQIIKVERTIPLSFLLSLVSHPSLSL